MMGSNSFRKSPWPKIPFGEVCLPKDLVDPRKSPDLMFEYVDISSVSNSQYAILSSKTFSGKDAPSRARKRIRAGDIIFSTTRPYLRSIARVGAELDGQICSTGFCVLRAAESVMPEWLFYFCLGDEIQQQIVPKMRGATYPAVSDGDVMSCLIPLPSVSEQGRIVGRIRQMLALTEEISTLHKEAWTEARLLQPSFLSGIEHSLQCKRVAIGDVLLGTNNGRSIRAEGGPTNGYVLSLSAVRSLELNTQQCKAISLDDVTADKYSIDAGDVFISRSNTYELVGLASIAVGAGPRRTIYPDLLIKLIPNTAFIDPWYLATVLRFPSVRDLIRSRAKGTSQSMVKISGESLKMIQIPLPSLREQMDIVARVKGFAAINAEMNDSLAPDNTRVLRDRILQKAFAGEL